MEHRARHTFGSRIQRCREFANRPVRGRHVERNAAAQRAGGDVSEHDMRVRHRCRYPSATECGRPRNGSRASRADAQRAAVVDPSDAATTGGHGLDEHARQRDRHARDAPARLDERLSVENETDIGARSPDVHRERVGETRRTHGSGRTDHAARGPRQREGRRAPRRLDRRAHSPA